VGVDLETERLGDEFAGENFGERGIEGAGPDRGIEEMDFLAAWQERVAAYLRMSWARAVGVANWPRRFRSDGVFWPSSSA
jgi:hypothetical protein